MTQAIVLRYVLVLADGQDTCSGQHFAVTNDQCTVVKRCVFKEYILYQTRGHLRIQALTCIDDLFEAAGTGQHDECAGLGRSHMTASLRDFQYLLTGSSFPFGSARTEDFPRRETRTDAIEEHTDLFLKNHNQGDSTDGDDTVKKRTGKVELEYKTDQKPYDDKR